MDHPITPPPELVKKWQQEANHNEPMFPQVAAMAAQWGADTELEACCEWLESEPDPGHVDLLRSCATALRAARRPKPPSLKKQALALIDDCTDPHGDYLDDDALSTIRRALEELPDD